MKMAHIVPVPDLDLIKDNDIHLCLAHLALGNPTYKEFYAERVREGKFVILDNGTAEGSLVSFESLSQMIEEIHPSEVVIPDVLHDKEESLKLADGFLNHLLRSRAINGGLRFMMAVQGRNLKEYTEAAEEVAKWGIVNTIGASKFMCNVGVNRVDFLRHITVWCSEVSHFHILGLNSVDELKSFAEFNGLVRSVDSCFAALFAQNNSLLDKPHWRAKEFQFQFEVFRGKYKSNVEKLEGILNNM